MSASFDSLDHYVRQVYGLPDNWSGWHYQSIRPDDDWSRDGNLYDLFQITGAVCPLYVRGPKKGRPNYKKADQSTKRTFTFTKRALAEWYDQSHSEAGQ
jgi:hypothetical protein